MASFSVPSVTEGSDIGIEYYCTVCKEEQHIYIDADFYCKNCVKFFCKTCINSHTHGGWRALFKPSPYGKDKIMKWPLSEKMEKLLRTCDLHKDGTLTLYCPDHSQLCCSRCIEPKHRLCFQVTSILQASKMKSTKIKKLSVRTQNTLLHVAQFETYQEDRMRSLKVSYNEHEKDMVEGMRLNIKTFLHMCENSTVNETHEQNKFYDIREKIISILVDFEKSTVKEKKEELKLKQAPLMSVRNSCVRLHDELLQLHYAIQKVLGRHELSFIARKKCQEKIQQSDTFTKENFPNYVFSVNGKTVHNVKMPSDSDTCWIEAVCALPDGQVLVADSNNYTVKLLNQQYQVVSHWDATYYIGDMCQITPSEVAVAMNKNASNIHEVQFISVTQSQLAPGRKLELQHTCRGIAHHQGDLYICSRTALYKYTLSGKKVCRLYEDKSVYKCAVSPTGDRLYITNHWQDKLLTLARDGTLLAIYTDPAREWPTGLHVTPAGQVLVCVGWPHTVLQVGWEGKSKLATLATQKDGLRSPRSVCYSSTTSSIIVGQSLDNILVFRVE
ncbi:uncharacterized protein LOC127864276 [Dreissena polymorpha]|nr:uncharacterized protein LOC127864276 [Dreissena polymorpha]